MVLIIIPAEAVYNGQRPRELNGYIDDRLWQQIVSGLNNADSNANCNACAGELLCCFFGIPLLLCHCCIAGALADSQRTTFLNNINRQFYNGRPVLSTTQSNGILINTDFMPTMGVSTIQDSYVPTVAAYIPQEPQSQTISITIPPGASPGSVLTVQAPDGSMVQVTVPPGSFPGQQIQVRVATPTPTIASPIYSPPTPAYAAPVPIAQQPARLLSVTIPPGVAPGSTMQVMAPDGTKVEVMVPQGSRGGEVIQVSY